MRIDIITILPEMFEAPLSASMIGIAREKGALDLHVHDLRDWTTDRHRTTDDEPYGGGPGMVMKPEPIFSAVEQVAVTTQPAPHTVFLTPGGEVFDQRVAEELATFERILLVCGRYEGFDERVYTLADRLLSIGDYVLTGGELAAMVVTDCIARLLPGVLGHEDSAADESFSEGLLEYPQYTRPSSFRGLEVPEVLRSGDHARIRAFRREQALRTTARYRPDLLEGLHLDETEKAIVADEIERRAQGD